MTQVSLEGPIAGGLGEEPERLRNDEGPPGGAAEERGP